MFTLVNSKKNCTVNLITSSHNFSRSTHLNIYLLQHFYTANTLSIQVNLHCFPDFLVLTFSQKMFTNLLSVFLANKEANEASHVANNSRPSDQAREWPG
jgi:hypothetical protein